MKLSAGMPAPTFTAKDQNDKLRTSAEFENSKLVLFFYPNAFTPGCTTEVCDFRDRHEFLTAQGYEILGVSPNKPEKLAAFKAEYNLPYDLLSDPDNSIAESYGAFGIKKNYGKEYKGIIRSTFKIDEKGVIEDAFYNVKATGHAERITNSIGG